MGVVCLKVLHYITTVYWSYNYNTDITRPVQKKGLRVRKHNILSLKKCLHYTIQIETELVKIENCQIGFFLSMIKVLCAGLNFRVSEYQN